MVPPVPTLSFDDATLTMELLSGPFFIILLSIISGILVGKQESDSGDPKKKNETLFDWTEDAIYGFLGGILLTALAAGGAVNIPIVACAIIGGFGGRKFIRDLLERYGQVSVG